MMRVCVCVCVCGGVCAACGLALFSSILLYLNRKSSQAWAGLRSLVFEPASSSRGCTCSRPGHALGTPHFRPCRRRRPTPNWPAKPGHRNSREQLTSTRIRVTMTINSCLLIHTGSDGVDGGISKVGIFGTQNKLEYIRAQRDKLENTYPRSSWPGSAQCA
jgi:hypothetical protein